MKLLTRWERETLRESFRPKRIRILFIGEAPPASGRFFYSANSGLYRAMRDAFRTVDPQIDDENFLSLFQALGCYLTDLSPTGWTLNRADGPASQGNGFFLKNSSGFDQRRLHRCCVRL